MGLDRQKIIRTLRVSLTCIFIFLLTWYYQVPESAWCLITIWFVMYEYETVGGVLTKSYLRFIGTTLSALYGIIVIYFCDNNPLINIMALIPGLFVYAYFFMGSSQTYIGTIGAVTLTIVLLNYNNVDTAVLRVANIIIGIVGCMFMMRFFYPRYARDMVIDTLSNCLNLLSMQLEDFLNPARPFSAIKAELSGYENNRLKDFLTFDRLIVEAKMETKKAPFFIPHATAAMHQLRILSRLVNVFISHLSIDDFRTDPWITNQLRIFLLELQNIQCRLHGEKPEIIESTAAENTDEPEIEATVPYNKHATEMLLNSMHQEASLLNEEIKNIVLIYDIYRVNTAHN